MIKAVVFDVDDTLYDLSTPFKEACREVFPEDTDLDLEGAFLASRRYSDSVYASSLSGRPLATCPRARTTSMTASAAGTGAIV